MTKLLMLLTLGLTLNQLYASVTVPIGKWTKDDLNVCFATSSQKKLSRFFEEVKNFPSKPNIQNASNLEKETIKNILFQEYTVSKTGIHFSGFEDCSNLVSSDLYVYMGKSGERGPIAAAKLGQDLVADFWEMLPDPDDGIDTYTSLNERRPGQGPGYVYIEKFKSYANRMNQVAVDEKKFLELAALHEFGHAAGLAHEDTRVETNSNAYCGVANLKRDRFKNGHEEYTSEFDPYSIMSYCFINSIRDTLGLHFAVARPGLPQQLYPKLPIPVMTYFGPGSVINDPALLVSKNVGTEFTEVNMRIGLSTKDQLALKTLYKE